jgi:hypothetical protein
VLQICTTRIQDIIVYVPARFIQTVVREGRTAPSWRAIEASIKRRLGWVWMLTKLGRLVDGHGTADGVEAKRR